MNLKKISLIGILFIFLISFITHNLYTLFPSHFTAFFFPVNESIWEHQKMIFSTYIIWGLFLYILLKKYKLNSYNIVSAVVLSALTNIIIFLIIYIPIYLIMNHNLIITLLIYFITIVISQVVSYYILKSDYLYKKLNIFSFIIALITIIIFIYLTYKPIKNNLLFYDESNHKYGVYTYYDSSFL